MYFHSLDQFNYENSRPDQTVLAVIYNKNNVGFAFFNYALEKMQILDDLYEEKFTFEIITSACEVLKPGKIITISGQPEKIYEGLKAITAQLEDQNNFIENDRLIILSKSEYSYINCLNRTQCFQLKTEPPNINSLERKTYLNSLINFGSCCVVHAIGLLLLFNDKHYSNISYLTCEQFLTNDYLYLSEQAYTELDIIHSKEFSLRKKGKKGVCEDLFSLFNHCHTQLGEKYLWKMFKQPVQKLSVLNERYDFIEFCSNPMNASIVKELKQYLSQMRNLNIINLNQSFIHVKNVKSWKLIYEALKSVLNIMDICELKSKESKTLSDISQSISDQIVFITYLLEYTIDFELNNKKTFFIKYGIDNSLDILKSIYNHLPETLSCISPADLKSLPSEIEKCHLVYVPEIGYVLAVIKWKIPVVNVRNIETLEFKFSAGKINYYKNFLTQELDKLYGDISYKINKRSCQIVTRLANQLDECVEIFVQAIQKCAELDALMSLYTVAFDQNYVRPQMIDDQKLCITSGRHPILEQKMTYVSNDTFSENDEGLIKIITGPCNSGKTSYIKQISLIVFMAHIGSFVPAESASIGIMSNIILKSNNHKTALTDSNSYLQDIQQVTKSFSTVRKNSLILIDEFGKNTSEIDAFALLSAIILEFSSRLEACPHVFIITHFLNINEWIPDCKPIDFQQFDFIFGDESISYLFRLIKGRLTSSYILSVAHLIKVDEKILSIAKKTKLNWQLNEPPCKLSISQRKNLDLSKIKEIFSSDNLIFTQDLINYSEYLFGEESVEMQE